MFNKLKNINFFSRISLLDKLLFTKHLALMLKSGITVVESLDALTSQNKSSAFQKILIQTLADVENGLSLATALKKHSNVFGHFYISLVEVGEESGTLEKNLVFLADQLNKQHSLQKKIQGVMLYPTIVLSAAAVVGGFISYVIFPQLINFFYSLEVPLPLSTKILLFFARIMKDYGLFIFTGFILLMIFLHNLIKVPTVKKRWQSFLLSTPLIGVFLQNIQLVSFCHNLGIMLKSGLTVTSSLEIMAKETDNLIFHQYILRIAKAVDKGKNIAQELSGQYYHFIPSLVAKMIAVGEKTGRLDETLSYLGDFFEDEVDNTAKNMSTILEPILLLGIGIVVAFIALAIITPIYQLTGSIRSR